MRILGLASCVVVRGDNDFPAATPDHACLLFDSNSMHPLAYVQPHQSARFNTCIMLDEVQTPVSVGIPVSI